MPVEEHDELMSYVLGLSHAVNIAFFEALRQSGKGYDDLNRAASTTFRRQVETSRDVASENSQLYFEIQHLNPFNKDALEYLQKQRRDWAGWKMVSNLPYSVASPLLVELAQSRCGPDGMVVTLQIEVARRLVATFFSPSSLRPAMNSSAVNVTSMKEVAKIPVGEVPKRNITATLQ